MPDLVKPTASDLTAPESEAAYPPPPWRLRGQAQGHVFSVPAPALPATPAGFRPLVVAGHGLVAAGWVDYQGGSVLSYGELFAAVVGWRGRRLSATVTHMWVDSPASRAGGRELWGYPKELAEFDLCIAPDGPAMARLPDGAELAQGTYRSRLTLPVRLRVPGGTIQPRHESLIFVRAVFGGRLSLGSGVFTPGELSPLRFLSGARRLVSFGLADFDFTFGL